MPALHLLNTSTLVGLEIVLKALSSNIESVNQLVEQG